MQDKPSSSFLDNGIVSLDKNEWLRKCLNSTQKYFLLDQKKLSFPYRFGPDLVPNEVTLEELVGDIRVKDLVWIPISMAWTCGLAHWKYHYKSPIFPLYVAGGFLGGIFCLFSNAYARLGGFVEHHKKYGPDAYFASLEKKSDDGKAGESCRHDI